MNTTVREIAAGGGEMILYHTSRVKTRKAAGRLKWIGADTVTGVKEYKELQKKKQDEYQSRFAAESERLSRKREAKSKL